MLKCGQTTIDLSRLSANAIAISKQLIMLSHAYKQRCLVILDPFLNPIDASFMSFYRLHQRLHQIRIMHPSVLAVRCPWLIELDLHDKYEQSVLSYMIDCGLKQLDPESISTGKGQQYCAWLFTHKKAQSIAKDLATLALQKRNRKKILLRYYDPAVFFQLMSLFSSKQQNKLLGYIEMWTMLNRQGMLRIHRHEGEIYPAYIGDLIITDEQYQQLDCIGINNKIIQSKRLENKQTDIDELQSLQKIMPCLLRLKQKNIEDQDVQFEWAKFALKWGQDFDLTPKIAEQIQDLSKASEYYSLVKKLQVLSQ
jgi:hypothetical protein